jgi:membrane-bound lytic murein transglycosylase B
MDALMAGSPAADGSGVTSTRRVSGRLVAAVLLIATVTGTVPAAALADEPVQTPPTTVFDPTAPTTTTPTSTTAPTTASTTSTTPASTSTTAPPGFAADEPLPPATPGPPPAEDTTAPPPPPPPPPPGADDAGRRRAAVELKAAEAALRAGQAELRRRQALLLPVQRRMFAAQARMALLSEQEKAVAGVLDEARAKVKKMAVAGYVRGGDSQGVDFLLRAEDPADFDRRRTLVATATASRKAALQGYETAQRGAGADLAAAVAALDEAQAAVAQVQAQVDDAATAVMLLQAAVDNQRQLLDLAAATAPVPPTDIPRLYLDAYRRAAVAVNKRSPLCHIGWPAVAAIGRVESNHGRYQGTQLALNGDSYPHIIGIPLDGTRTALVRDTDAGVLDGDLEFDRAVGPMQFIPSTWARIGEDGNGDGVVDPNNAYDAALSTASYLCRAVPNGGLDDEETLRTAFFSYNHAASYVDAVALLARQYGEMAAALP